jgi:hypothetical protein
MEKDGDAGRASQDIESGREGISHWKMILDQGVTTKEIEEYDYEGEGTEDDPYVVEWIENDPRNPMVGYIILSFHVRVLTYSRNGQRRRNGSWPLPWQTRCLSYPSVHPHSLEVFNRS